MAFLNEVSELPSIGSKIVKYRSIGEDGDHVIIAEFEDNSEIYFHYSLNDGNNGYVPAGEFNPEDYLDDSEKQAKEIAELKEEVARLKIQKQIAEDERDMARKIQRIPYPNIPWPQPNPDKPNPWTAPWPYPYDPYKPYVPDIPDVPWKYEKPWNPFDSPRYWDDNHTICHMTIW